MLNDFETDTLLEKFFAEQFNASNFLYVYKFMDGYVDVDKSSDLGRYYMKGKIKSAMHVTMIVLIIW